MPKIAINGFGRIGRNVFKAGFNKPGFNVVAVNDLTDPKTLAHLLKHDSSYHDWDKSVSSDADELIVAGKKVKVFAEKDPAALPWKKLGVDIVLECTGRFTDFEGASKHLAAGAKRVILSAPAKGGGVPTHVLGVNQKGAGKKAKVINNASCTTNCIAPVAAVLHSVFGIRKAMMTTIHAYTADQVLVDGPHKDLRRARGAAQNIIPTTTGAATATTEVIPELKGLFDGLSIRVPVPVVSLSDFTFVLKKRVTVEQINEALTKASQNPLWKGILEVTNEQLVSSDFIGSSASCIVDLPMTKVVDGDLVKVIAWYDNEWGYSHRLAEMALEVGKNLK
ncbi:type I glyceraldehyde-3-phosphate dehydrogenase [Patescibacteria group bacterium]|jgi:glyceraldehyde 3-phosphate dehydrogenase|nr:type I glyceraldehyde-3-phosphate dehydrogenase [Patescibacteria group bacterium]